LSIVDLLQERKKRILQLEQQVSAAKRVYADTLQNLEKMSDDIHSQRRRQRQHEKTARKLAKASVNETVIYHPLMDVVSSSSDDDSGNETCGDVDSTELTLSPLTVPPLVAVVAVKDITVRQIDCVAVPNSTGQLSGASSVRVNQPEVEEANRVKPETSAEKPDVETVEYQTSSLSVPVSPECDIEQIQTNAAVMAAISRSKLQRVANPFLRPDACREDFSVNGGSETESVSGSFVSGGIGTLDDEQIESLMVDITEYQRIVADMDSAESDRYQQMALPARLRHLQDFVKFEPIWVEDDGNDGAVVGATENCGAECEAAKSEMTDDHVFTDSEKVEPDCSNSLSHSSQNQRTDDTLGEKEAEADNLWHPLMDNISSITNVGE